MFRFFRDAWTSNRTIRNPKPKTRPSVRTRLSLDQLEDRVTPATLVVTTLQDIVANDGLLSLREAIQATNSNSSVHGSLAGNADGDIITFNIAGNNGAGGTINLTSELAITDDVAMDGTDLSGPAGASITIKSTEFGRAFLIGTRDGIGLSHSVTLRDLAIQGGTAVPGPGGAIAVFWSADVTLDTVILTNGTAGTGGAIANFESKLTILNSSITGNTAGGTDPGTGGGAILNDQGTLLISNTNITGNQLLGNGSGGGILNLQGTVTVTGGSISDNNAQITGDPQDGRYGGAIENNAGTLELDGVILSNNRVAGQGGAIHTKDSASVTINGGSLTYNYAADGGAIWVSVGGNLDATDVTVDHNTADSSLGGFAGGGIYNAGGTVKLVNATVTNNQGIGTAPFAAVGGGLFQQAGSLIIQGGVFAHNSAGSGGALRVEDGTATITGNALFASNSAHGTGGAISIDGAVTFNMTGGTIGGTSADGMEGNRAGSAGGAIFMRAGNVTLTDVTIGSATNAPGDGNSAARGGAFALQGNSDVLHIINSTVSGNAATQGDGGGLWLSAGEATVSGSTFAFNSASEDGGAVFTSGRSLTITSSNLVDNEAEVFGGGIASQGHSLVINGGSISRNKADQGGGLHLSGSDVVVTGAAIGSASAASADGNTSRIGGGIVAGGGTLMISDSNMLANKASWYGGGIVLDGETSVSISDSTLAYNTAGTPNLNFNPRNDGGAIFVGSGQLSLETTTISDNQAVDNGGGIMAYGGTVHIDSSTIAFNVADSDRSSYGYGAGIAVQDASVYLRNTIVAKNTGNVDIYGLTPITSQGYNLIPSAPSYTLQGDLSTNIYNVDPLLGLLASNGGNTLTRALAGNSPAINTGDPTIVTADQTGRPRPLDGGVDIGAFEFSLDTTAPDSPSVTLQSDTGIVGDKITSDGTLSLGGVEQGATVQYSIDDGETWTNSFTALVGSNTVRVRQIDAAGNTSGASAAFGFILDNLSPTTPGVSLLNDTGINGDHVTSDGLLSLSGLQADAVVEYLANGSSVWSSTFAAIQGMNTVLVRQRDVADNSAVSPPFTFVFDNSAPASPTVSLLSDTGFSSSDKRTKNGSLSLGAIEANSIVEYSIDGTNWRASFNPMEGANTVQVRQADLAGNMSAASLSLTFILDTSTPTSPTVILATDTGSSNSDKLTSYGYLGLIDLEANAIVEYSIDGTHWNTSFTPAEGSNSVQVRQSDRAGNTSTASAALTFTLDTSAAVVTSLSSPSPNPRSTSVTSLDVVFSEPIDLATFDYSDLVLQRNGSNVPLNSSNVTVAATAEANTYRIQLQPALTANNGAYTFRVVAWRISDLASNASTNDVQTAWSVTVNAAPGVPTITGPSGAINDATPTITWTAANYAARYDLWVDSLSTGASQIIRQVNVQGTSFTPGANLPFGSYRVWVRSVSDGGIFSAWSAAVDFRTTTPAITGPTGNASSATPTITWTAIDGAAKYDLWVDNLTSGASQVMRRTDLTTNSATPANALPSGNYRAWVRAIDAAGNSTAWSVGGDFAVGIVTVTSPVGTASSTPTINWSAIAGASRYDIWVDNLTTGASQVVRQTNVLTNSYAVTTPLASGQHSVWVRSFAANGAASAWSKAFDFYVSIPTVTAPTGSVLTATPTIAWNGVANAVRYDLWVDNLTTGQSQAIRQTNLTTTSFTPSTPLASGNNYRIWVRAFNAQNIATAWSPFADFTIGNIV